MYIKPTSGKREVGYVNVRILNRGREGYKTEPTSFCLERGRPATKGNTSINRQNPFILNNNYK